MQSLARVKGVSGIVWTVTGLIGAQGLHYIFLLLLAALLGPANFGLFGIASMFILVGQAIAESGMVSAIVRQPNIDDHDVTAAFWINLVVNLLLAAICFFEAENISTFLGDASAAPLLQILALHFLIIAFMVPAKGIMQRSGRFPLIASQQVVGELIFGAVGLILAMAGAGVWSLVIASIVHRLMLTIMLWINISWRPTFRFDSLKMRHLLSFGFPVMLVDLLNLVIYTIDYFVIGHWLGAEALGYYTLAFQLAVTPAQRIIAILQAMTLPSFSLLQDDLSRLKASFFQGLQHLFVVLVPFSIFLAVLAPWFIEAIYGPRWRPATPTLQILAFAALFYGFDFTQSLFFAVGRPKIRLWLVGLRLVLFVVCSATFGLSLGIVGIALSMTIAIIVSGLSSFIVVSRVIPVTWRELVQPILPSVRGVLLACVPALALIVWPMPTVPPWLIMLGMGALYVLAILPTYRASITHFSRTTLQRLGRS